MVVPVMTCIPSLDVMKIINAGTIFYVYNVSMAGNKWGALNCTFISITMTE